MVCQYIGWKGTFFRFSGEPCAIFERENIPVMRKISMFGKGDLKCRLKITVK